MLFSPVNSHAFVISTFIPFCRFVISWCARHRLNITCVKSLHRHLICLSLLLIIHSLYWFIILCLLSHTSILPLLLLHAVIVLVLLLHKLFQAYSILWTELLLMLRHHLSRLLVKYHHWLLQEDAIIIYSSNTFLPVHGVNRFPWHWLQLRQWMIHPRTLYLATHLLCEALLVLSHIVLKGIWLTLCI